jgi:hypothetical protein
MIAHLKLDSMSIDIKDNSWQSKDFNIGTVIGLLGVLLILPAFIGMNIGNWEWLGALLFALGFYLHRSIRNAFIENEHIKKEQSERKKAEVKLKSKNLKENNSLKAKVSKFIIDLDQITIPHLIEFRGFLSEYETDIIAESDRKTLYNLLKINEFLEDYRTKIIDYKNYTQSYCEKEDGYEFYENWKYRNFGESKITLKESIRMDILNFINSTPSHKDNLNTFILNYNYYHNLAIMTIVFLIHKKQLQYLEIYSAFEKLGAFDSSWQKSIALKLNDIEDSIVNSIGILANKLDKIDSSFQNLNNQIASFEDSLKSIDTSIQTNNMLSTINLIYLRKISKR